MRQHVAGFFIIAILSGVGPSESASKMLDGFDLEGAPTSTRGSWNLKTGLQIGTKAKPVKISSTVSGTGSDKELEVSTILFPVELRYGLSENWELGGDIGFESNRGGVQVNSDKFLSGSGLRRLRFFGKWNFWRDITGMADLAFAGDNKLYYSLDSFDLGLKFIYGPQLGSGMLNMNLGFLIKGGDVKVGTTLTVDYGSPVISFGIGYAYPFSDRFAGVFELAGASATYDGGTGVASTNGPLSILFGGRYGLSDQLLLDGGLGFGIGKGSPGIMVKGGLDWMWGAAPEYASTEPSTRWSPSGETKKTEAPARVPAQPTPTAPAGAGTPPKSDQPYYEPPARYETPRQEAPPAPSGPTLEEQLQNRVADASAAFTRGDYVTAAAQYEAAIKLKDNDPMLYYNLATAYFQIKKYADAKTYYKNAVTYNPADPDSHLYLGYTYYYLQDQPSAIREWQKVLEIDPSNSLARENLKSLGVE